MNELSRGAQRCLQILQYYSRGKGYCWPAQSTLAEKLGVTVRQVKRYIRELKESGYVTSNQRPNTSCMYNLQIKISLPGAKMSLPNSRNVPSDVPSTIKITEVKPRDTDEHVREYFGEVLIAGKRADEAAIQRVASLISPGQIGAYRIAVRRFRDNCEIKSWGALIRIAEEMNGQEFSRRDKFGERRPPLREEYNRRKNVVSR